MTNEDHWHHQELSAYFARMDAPYIVTPKDFQGAELEPSCHYWRVQYRRSTPIYIWDDLDDINAYMEQNYEGGGGLNDYHEAVTQLHEAEADCISYVLYCGNGQEEERKWIA